MDMLKQVFQRWDLDGDEVLTVEEIKIALEAESENDSDNQFLSSPPNCRSKAHRDTK